MALGMYVYSLKTSFWDLTIIIPLFQMMWRTILLRYCFLLVSCLLNALEAVPIDIDKTKVKNTQPVDSAKIEPPVSEMIKIILWEEF